MRKKIIALIIFGFCIAVNANSQCLDRDSLWQRLVYLRTAPGSLDEKLKEMLQYESNISKCSYINDSTHAFLLLRIGGTYYRLGDFLPAARYTRRSINMIYAYEAKPSINTGQLISSYFYLSVIYDSLKMVREKIEALDSCIAVASRQRSIDQYSLDALYKRTEYSFDIGDYHRSFSYAVACEKLALEYGKFGVDEYNSGLGYAINSVAWKVNFYLKLREYDQAEALLAKRVEEYKKPGLDIYLATLYHQQANVRVSRGNYSDAIIYYKKALFQARKFKLTISAKVILNDLGYSVFFKQYKDWGKALKTFNEALLYKDETQKDIDAVETLNILNNIANVYVKQKKFDTAFHFFQLAFDQINKGSNETVLLYTSLDNFVQTKRIDYLTSLLIDKGDAFVDQFNTTGDSTFLKKGTQVYKIADRILDRIKTEQSELLSKLFWRESTRRLYEHAIDLCYKNGKIDDAFYFFEKSRAVLLNDQLNQQRWLSNEDVQKQVQAKKKILKVQRELASLSPTASDYAKLQRELLSTQVELDRLVSVLKVANPLYYQSFLDTSFVSLSDVQKTLMANYQGLLEIFSGDSSVYSFVITSKNAVIFKIDKNLYEDLAKQFISFLSNRDLINRKFQDFVSVANKFYQLLFPGNFISPGRIIISPDGYHFPFEALVTGSVNKQPTYFLEKYAVSYIYSVRFLLNNFSASQEQNFQNFLGVAPIRYPADMHLASLIGSDRSLEQVRNYFNDADQLVAKEASKGKFVRQFSRYKIIQLYTHASDSSIFNEPAIYFADSALYLSELVLVEKPLTRLIVLSACETGIGKVYKGEGVFSFSRGFAALGIPSSVANLWSVDNESTYLLTELFYKHLSTSIPADIALQEAKREFIKNAPREKSLPYFWAAPVLVGKSETLYFKKRFPWELVILILASVSLAVWLGIKMRKSGKTKTN